MKSVIDHATENAPGLPGRILTFLATSRGPAPPFSAFSGGGGAAAGKRGKRVNWCVVCSSERETPLGKPAASYSRTITDKLGGLLGSSAIQTDASMVQLPRSNLIIRRQRSLPSCQEHGRLEICPPPMKTVGVISDTHGLLRPERCEALAGVDLIVHGGDIGEAEIIHALRRIAPVHAIRGNVDHGFWSDEFSPTEIVDVNGQSLYVLHDLPRWTSIRSRPAFAW